MHSIRLYRAAALAISLSALTCLADAPLRIMPAHQRESALLRDFPWQYQQDTLPTLALPAPEMRQQEAAPLTLDFAALSGESTWVGSGSARIEDRQIRFIWSLMAPDVRLALSDSPAPQPTPTLNPQVVLTGFDLDASTQLALRSGAMGN